MNMFRSVNIEIDRYDETQVLLVIYNKTLANKVNRELGRYYDATIRDHESPVFLISQQELARLMKKRIKGMPLTI